MDIGKEVMMWYLREASRFGSEIDYDQLVDLKCEAALFDSLQGIYGDTLDDLLEERIYGPR
jgi:hypothetical protein